MADHRTRNPTPEPVFDYRGVNALAESVIGLYETELIRQKGPWHNLDQVNYATHEYVDWFNHRRLLEPIGDIPPTEKERLRENVGFGCASARCGVMLRGFLGRRNCWGW